MDSDRVNHLDLLRETVAISTKVDRLIQDQSQLYQALSAENGIYARLNKLEQRWAQVMVVAVACGLVLPVFVTVAIDRIWPAATMETRAGPTS